ncbi:HNH endonuclease [Streptomyces sp. A1136]|nr:HNH endonuclease [Streptomyces sp. A1136]
MPHRNRTHTDDTTTTSSVTGGVWWSCYDDTTVTEASKLDIDHMVPLAEAWDSGASAWTPVRREAYANDQGQLSSLVAVTARSNRSKADQDPAQWLPLAPDAVCRYGAEWTATKLRWGLAVDEAERERLLDIAAGCGGTDVEFTRHRRPGVEGLGAGPLGLPPARCAPLPLTRRPDSRRPRCRCKQAAPAVPRRERRDDYNPWKNIVRLRWSLPLPGPLSIGGSARLTPGSSRKGGAGLISGMIKLCAYLLVAEAWAIWWLGKVYYILGVVEHRKITGQPTPIWRSRNGWW